jgi:hypothetical protein
VANPLKNNGYFTEDVTAKCGQILGHEFHIKTRKNIHNNMGPEKVILGVIAERILS